MSTIPELFVGTERFFRPGYNANLVSAWIPALDGVEAKLKDGARVADVGCGLGASTILMAGPTRTPRSPALTTTPAQLSWRGSGQPRQDLAAA